MHIRFVKNKTIFIICSQIFIDRESISNALAASNDAHLLQIDNLADKIAKQAKEWSQTIMEEINSNQKHKRNRSRIMEINLFIDSLQNEMENLDVPALSKS